MRSLQQYRTSCNDAVFLNDTMVHDDRAHTNQHIVFDRATMNHGAVTDANIVANDGSGFLIRAVNDGAVLNVYFIPQNNAVDITPYDGLKPNAALVAHFYITHNGGVFSDKNIFSPLGRFVQDW
jgi:hypothetical protein